MANAVPSFSIFPLPSSTNIKQTQHDAKRIGGGKESKAAGQTAASKDQTKQSLVP